MKTIEQIIEQNVEKLSDPGRNFPELQERAVYLNGDTTLRVFYNHQTGEIAYPGVSVKGNMPGGPYQNHSGEATVGETDPQFFSQVTIELKYLDRSVPYKLMGDEDTGSVYVQRQGDCQFNFGMAPGDKVIEKTIKAYNAKR